jgi:hypothetical protein
MIGMMMSIPLGQHLDRHAEIASGLPHVGARLHWPSRSSVSSNMRCDVIPKPGISDHIGECLIDIWF